MTKQPAMRVLFLAVLTPLLVGIGGFFGAMYYIEAQRVRDAESAFRPLAPLGACILSNPCAFHRHCCYIVEFPARSALSDANTNDLICLNRLPERNELSVYIETQRVTDKSLARLQAIRTLDYLDVTNSAITDKGIEELREALPHATVFQRSSDSADTGRPHGPTSRDAGAAASGSRAQRAATP